MSTRNRTFLTLAVVVMACFAMTTSAQATVILSTDFTGRTHSGNTASNITWAVDGVVAPSGSLTAVPEGGGTVNGFLPASIHFTEAEFGQHFRPARNLANEGAWSATIAAVTLTVPQIDLEDLVLDWGHYGGTGAIQTSSRTVTWSVSVTGSSSGPLGSVAVTQTGLETGQNTLAFAPISLYNTETYDITMTVADGGPLVGNNAGFGKLTFNGTIIPEPATLTLLACGSIGVLLKRRRRRA